MPERDPHPQLYDALDDVLAGLIDARLAGPHVVRFELQLLSELGFGLDLGECAATGTTIELAYVSPKSGRAVSRAAGQPWQDKLLRLPGFLGETPAAEPSAADVTDGFAMTGFFLSRHVFEPRGLPLPDARASFINAVTNAGVRERALS